MTQAKGTLREHIRQSLCVLFLNTTFHQVSFFGRDTIEKHLKLSADSIETKVVENTENKVVTSLVFDFGDAQMEFLCTFVKCKAETPKEKTEETPQEVEVERKWWHFFFPPKVEETTPIEKVDEEKPRLQDYWLLKEIA